MEVIDLTFQLVLVNLDQVVFLLEMQFTIAHQQENMKNQIADQIKLLEKMLSDESLQSTVDSVILELTKALSKGLPLLVFGNGGSAADALHMGLVKQVTTVGELDAVVDAYAANVCENAPLTLAAAKRALLELRKNPEQRDLARVKAMVDACFMSEDYKEGRKAFAEQRPPQFKAQ